ncbi:MAG: glucose-6-phosphate isomerase [Firmicutes bacterium]|nr:glucose-6-phosphate isomerase [Bacillota bacterium]
MSKISFEYKTALPFLSESEIFMQKEMVNAAHNMLHGKSGAGNDYLGWVNLPSGYDKEEFAKIQKSAEKINKNSDILIVIGIGGSYLGSRAAIEFLTSPLCNHTQKTKIFFAGNSISGSYLSELAAYTEQYDFSINVISKSGTTTEPAIAFRIFKELAEKKYGKSGAKDRIFVTTDKSKGALKTLAEEEGYETFVIPDNIGGRFSVLTAVGLLPIAVSGADIARIMEGAAYAEKEFLNSDIKHNVCYQYAAARNALLKKGKNIEMLVNYEPSLHYFAEWWKQLFGESEGKDGKGIFPASADFSTDLHSLGQYIQDGMRVIFETILNVEESDCDITLKEQSENIDGLNFLAGKTVNYVNSVAMRGTMLAHIDGGVPNLLITIPKRNEYYFGQLVYFFEKACAISGYLLGVNPFNQPGVEAYKNNMFALLEKPGYEQQTKAIKQRLEQAGF